MNRPSGQGILSNSSLREEAHRCHFYYLLCIHFTVQPGSFPVAVGESNDLPLYNTAGQVTIFADNSTTTVKSKSPQRVRSLLKEKADNVVRWCSVMLLGH